MLTLAKTVPRHLQFSPDPDRVGALDAQVRQGLARSLATIGSALADDFAVPERALENLCRHLRARPAPPAAFALYADLVSAIERDDEAAISPLLVALADPALLAPSKQRVVTLSDDHLGAGMAGRYARIADDDPENRLPLFAVPADGFARSAATVTAGVELLRGVAPDLAGEVDFLARQIILARGPPGAVIFRGASTFYLWGAIFLNPDLLTTRVGVVEALAHETAHLLLFGMTGGQPVVLNAPEERYASPLRGDPRPMEGIAHATYVLARMLLCLDLLAKSALLNGAERDEVEAKRTDNRRLYQDGARVVRQFARLDEVGACILASCLAACPPDSPRAA